MLDDKTKMFLVKAMTEGISCNFASEDAKYYFIKKLKQCIEKNDKISSTVQGDPDGLLMEDSFAEPYAMIKLKDNLIIFGLLVPEPDLSNEQSIGFGRIVLACISTLALIEAEQVLEHGAEDYVANDESVKFNISEIGVII